MKIPNINCKIEMFGSINLSEDPNKIKTAITNIFPNSTVKTEKFSIHALSEELNSLEKIYETIHSKTISKNL